MSELLKKILEMGKQAEQSTGFDEDIDREVEVAGGDNNDGAKSKKKKKNPFAKKEEAKEEVEETVEDAAEEGAEEGTKDAIEDATEENAEEGGDMPPQEGQGAHAAPMTSTGSAGADAARAFIGPDVFGAAMQGDPGASNLVAQVAGQIAAATEEKAQMAAGAAAPAPDPMAQGGDPMAQEQGVDPSMQGQEGPDPMDPDGMADQGGGQPMGGGMAPQTPEDQAADQVTGQGQPMGGAPQPMGGGMGQPQAPMGGGMPMQGGPNDYVTKQELMQVLQSIQQGGM
jgi:hypothetical protein